MPARGAIFGRRSANSRSLRIASTRCWLAALLLLGLTACRGGPSGPIGLDDVDDRLGPAENLQRLAEAERGTVRPLAVPAPPGVDPSVLELRPSEDRAARLSVMEALDELEANAPPSARAPQRMSELDPETAQEALRHYVKGRDAALRERHLVAISELQKALDLDPGSAPILRELAQSLLAMGNSSRAAMLYERLLAIDPDNSEALFTLGLAASRRRDFAEAARMLGRPRLDGTTLGYDPAVDAIADFTLTQALDELGYDRAAIETARSALMRSQRLTQPTAYLAQYGAIYRQRGDLWRSVGDAHCRLGEFDRALHAYAISAQLPSPDPAALYPRVIFANLRLGRVFSSQLELLQVLAERSSDVTDREVRLCSFLADNSRPLDLIAASAVELYERHPDDPGLARAASAFLPRDEALALLRGVMERRPGDLDVLQQLYGWLVDSDLDGAIALTISLCEDQPTHAGDYVERLAVSLPEPSDALARLEAGPPQSPAQTQVTCRLLEYLGATGRAWGYAQQARDRWPDDTTLLILQLQLAAALQEPAIFARIADEARSLNDVEAWRAVARGQLEIGEVDAAVASARSAAVLAPEDAGALADLARAVAAAVVLEPEDERSTPAREAIRHADAAVAIEPDNEIALGVLLEVYGPGGALEQPDLYRQTVRYIYDVSPDALYLRLNAQESLIQQRYGEALEQLVSLYDADPTDVLSLSLAVTAWIGLDDLDGAQRWLEQQLLERPGNPALLEQWGRVLIRRERVDELEARLLDRLAANPGDVAARRLIESAYRAIESYEKALPYAIERLGEQPPGVRRAVELARIHADAGAAEEAIAQLQWVNGRHEDASYEILVQGILAAERLDEDVPERDALVADLVQATVERHPDAPLSVYGLGLRALLRRGELDERFDKLAADAAARAPGASESSVQGVFRWRDLAQSLINAGSVDGAARVLWARFDASAPLSADARGLLATWMYVADAASTGRAERTIELIRHLAARGQLLGIEGVDEQEAISIMLYQVSQIYAIVGNDEGANRLLEEAIAVDPSHVMAKNNLGYTRITQDRGDDETIELIEQAYAADPDDANIVDTLGWLRYKQGRFDEIDGEAGALQLIEASIQAAGAEGEPSAEVLDHLGDTLWRIGDQHRAIETWERVILMLDSDEFEHTSRDDYREMQRNWMLLVADPQEMYDRDFGSLLERARAKVEAVRSGNQPQTSPTFDEAASPGEAASR